MSLIFPVKNLSPSTPLFVTVSADIPTVKYGSIAVEMSVRKREYTYIFIFFLNSKDNFFFFLWFFISFFYKMSIVKKNQQISLDRWTERERVSIIERHHGSDGTSNTPGYEKTIKKKDNEISRWLNIYYYIEGKRISTPNGIGRSFLQRFTTINW